MAVEFGSVGNPPSVETSKVAAARVAATLGAARAAGLTTGKKAKRLSGRAHERLISVAAERSGLQGSELLEYALAKVALEDDFGDRLLRLEGMVSRDLDLEF
jgi:hypothetical protein